MLKRQPLGERLAGIATIEAANRFLETWLPRYNRRVVVQPSDLRGTGEYP